MGKQTSHMTCECGAVNILGSEWEVRNTIIHQRRAQICLLLVLISRRVTLVQNLLRNKLLLISGICQQAHLGRWSHSIGSVGASL